MKRRIFLVRLFYRFFLRLQIYDEVIAAIFWQSASYVASFSPPLAWTISELGKTLGCLRTEIKLIEVPKHNKTFTN